LTPSPPADCTSEIDRSRHPNPVWGWLLINVECFQAEASGAFSAKAPIWSEALSPDRLASEDGESGRAVAVADE
jgi:hypothetical protein